MTTYDHDIEAMTHDERKKDFVVLMSKIDGLGKRLKRYKDLKVMIEDFVDRPTKTKILKISKASSKLWSDCEKKCDEKDIIALSGIEMFSSHFIPYYFEKKYRSVVSAYKMSL